jgi:hypothetical protein
MDQYDSLSWLYEVLYAEHDTNQLGQAFLTEHEHIRQNPNISIFTKDKDLQVAELKAWKMKSIYK